MSILGNFQLRRDTAANWTAANPVLLDGEMGYEKVTLKFKVGDGTTAWNSLAYGGIKGDTGAQGIAGNVIKSVTLDFGAIPVDSKGFTFSDGSVTTSSKIVMTPAPDSDEYEMDGIMCGAYCAVNGTITAFATAHPGPVVGTRNFNYILG